MVLAPTGSDRIAAGIAVVACDELTVPVASTETRYDALIEQLREASQPSRKALAAFGSYLEKVQRHAYQVTDRDIQALREAGCSEDEIFEQTVSVAVAAGLDRLTTALEVLP
jgi:alkylhydroperoxidase family enzyme